VTGAWICFEDESGQVLQPPVARTWGRRGHTPVVRVSGRGSGRISVAGLACIRAGQPGRFYYRMRGHRLRPGTRRAMSEADYAALITAAHQGLNMAEQHDVVGQVRRPPSDRWLEPKRSGVFRSSGGSRTWAGIGFDAEDLPGAPGGLIIRAQPACRRPTAAFSIVGSSSSTAFAAGPSGMKLSSLVTRVIGPA
jgi:hypothetical protein